MAMTTVKISTETRDKLANLAAARKRPMSEVLSEIVERERRRAFLRRAQSGLCPSASRPRSVGRLSSRDPEHGGDADGRP